MGLMDSSYTYAQLREKYQDFTTPKVELNIGGLSLLEQKGISVEQVQIKLSTENAGSASFTINSGYDYEKSSFNSTLKDKVIPGKVVTVKVGYMSSTTEVFKGFIASVDVRFDVENGIFFTITAMDARRLMMTDNKPYALYSKPNYSDIVKTIMSRYAALCSLKCDDTNDKLEDVVSQRESDYDFITKKLIQAGRVDREFFIVADKAYFRKPRSVTSPVITLGINNGLKNFNRSLNYLNKVFEVHGYNPDTQTHLIGSAAAKSGDKQSDVIKAGIEVVALSDCKTQTDVADAAKSMAMKAKNENKKASGTCIGLPEIVPGRFIKISGVDSLINKKFYIIDVTHTINYNGFLTSFTTEGWD